MTRVIDHSSTAPQAASHSRLASLLAALGLATLGLVGCKEEDSKAKDGAKDADASAAKAAKKQDEGGAPPAAADAPDGKAPEAPPAAPPAAQGDYAADAAGLQSLFTDIRAAIASGDVAKAATLSKSLLPFPADLSKALKDDAEDAKLKIIEMHAGFAPANDEQAASMFAGKPERTEIQVHAATVEEILAPTTASHAEFPGGAKQAAETVLRPGATFYEVEFLEPGKDSGMKYHLVFHTGSEWKMLGPVWRVL